jgi:hypothetical protein
VIMNRIGQAGDKVSAASGDKTPATRKASTHSADADSRSHAGFGEGFSIGGTGRK